MHMKMRSLSLFFDNTRVYAKRKRLENLKSKKINMSVSQRIATNALSAWKVEY